MISMFLIALVSSGELFRTMGCLGAERKYCYYAHPFHFARFDPVL